MMMKALLIDPELKEITKVKYNGDYRQIYSLIGCKTFDLVPIPFGSDGIYIDDEGLYANVTHPWQFNRHHQPPIQLVNKGLVLGCDDKGDAEEPTISLDLLKHFVTWEWVCHE
tara:strand:+ start:660 stop:998 length:339 start_codon:yes stop_codon:yes gene_type:complete